MGLHELSYINISYSHLSLSLSLSLSPQVRLQHAARHIEEEVDLDSMTWEEHEDECGYSLVCRCGASVFMSEQHLAEGMDTVECTTCGLVYRVLFTVQQ